MKKSKMLSIVFVGVIIMSIVIIYIINNNRNKEDFFTSSYNEIIEKITNNSSTCSFEDYFKVVRAEYIILPNENLIKHSFVFQNITGKDISFNYQVYKEQELINKYLSSLAPALPPNAIPIELPAEKRAVASMASQFLYTYSSYTEDEKDNIDELASKLYIEFQFNGKFDYFEMDLQKVDQFSEY